MKAPYNWLMLIRAHDEGTQGMTCPRRQQEPATGVMAGLRAARRPRSCCSCRRRPLPPAASLPSKLALLMLAPFVALLSVRRRAVY